MAEKYSADDFDRAFLSLTEAQKIVLNEHVKRGKKTEWLNLWAKKKGMVLTKEELDNPEKAMESLLEWVLLDYEDSFFVNPDTRCECGRALRHRYTIMHKETLKTYKLGIIHLGQHTGLDAETVRLISKGLKVIDLERSEILSKVLCGWELPFSIPEGFSIPEDMREQLRVKLPLLDRQLMRLSSMIIKQQSFKTPSKKVPQRKYEQISFISETSYLCNNTAAKNLSTAKADEEASLNFMEIVSLYNKLKSAVINAAEAKKLYLLISSTHSKLAEHCLELSDIKKAASSALGLISSPVIREWLVEIECLKL